MIDCPTLSVLEQAILSMLEDAIEPFSAKVRSERDRIPSRPDVVSLIQQRLDGYPAVEVLAEEWTLHLRSIQSLPSRQRSRTRAVAGVGPSTIQGITFQ